MVFPVLLWKTPFYPGIWPISINSLSTTTLGNAEEKTIPSHSGKSNTSWKSLSIHFAITNQLTMSGFLCIFKEQRITSNETYSFLITLDVDIGELIMIKFKWENSMVWSNVWNTVQTIIPGEESPFTQALLWRASESKWEKHSKGECYFNLLVTSVECLPASTLSQFNTCIYLMKWALLCSNDGCRCSERCNDHPWVPKATGGRTSYLPGLWFPSSLFPVPLAPTQLIATCLQSLRTTHWPSAFQISPRDGPRTTFWTARTQKCHFFFVVYPEKCF